MSSTQRFVILAVVLVVSLGAVGVVAAGGHSSPASTDSTAVGAGLGTPVETGVDSDQRNESGDVEIDPALQAQAADSDDISVIVRFDSATEKFVEPQTAETHAEGLKMRAAQAQTPFERFAENHPGVEIERQFWLANANLVTVDTSKIPLEKLGAVENVARLHENFEVEQAETATVDNTAGTAVSGPTIEDSAVTQSTSETDFTRALEHVNVPQVWEQYGNRGEGVRVAVIDSGVNPDHPDIDLAPGGWVEFDEYGNEIDSTPYDNDGHGTHVSGTVAGGDSNDADLQIGAAPDVELLHANVFGTADGSFAAVIASMEWGVNNNADVLSLSLGAEGKYDTLVEPVRQAKASGSVVVAAVGNDGAGKSGSPANVYDALAVGSVNVDVGYPDGWKFGFTDDEVSSFSGGERIDTDTDWQNPPNDWPDTYVVPDLTAPGQVIWSADNNINSVTECGGAEPPTEELSCLQGTSMATPQVAGVVALMLSNTDAELSPAEVETMLAETAVDLGEDATRQGAGRIDAFGAVQAAVDAGSAKPNFGVTVDSTNSPVTEGENITVEYTVENTGTGSGTQDIVFAVNDTEADRESAVELGPGESTTETFAYETGSDDIGDFPVSVSSDNDTAERLVNVEQAPFFAVGIDSVETVTEGEEMAVGVTVENTGGSADTQTVALNVSAEQDGNVTTVDARETALAAGETGTFTLTYTTKTGDAPAIDLEVLSEQDSGNSTVAVAEPPFFEVEIDHTPETVTNGENATVEYTVENAGNGSGTQDIDFAVNDTLEASTTLTLDSGESTGGEFSYTTGETGAIDLTVSSDDDSATRTVTVRDIEDALFAVEITSAPTDVVRGENVTIDYTVENTGNVSGTQDIVVRVDGTETDRRENLTLESGETDAGQFTYQTGADDANELEFAVSSDNDSYRKSVRVDEPPYFDVTLGNVSASVTEGENVTVDYTVENTGDVSGTQDIELQFDNGTAVVYNDTRTVTLAATGRTNGTFEWATKRSDAGDYTATITSADDSDAAGTTVEPKIKPVVGDNPPRDLNGDGLYRDMQGDGEFNIFDVQTLFDNLDNDMLQANAELFNFSGNDENEVDIFDVQALFEDLRQK